VREEPAHHEAADTPALLILDGPQTGERVSVRAELLVGRGEDVGLDVGDHEISRRHARFRRAGDRLEVADLGSLNGTRVNGRQIADATALKPGDVVELGTTRLQVVQPQVRRTAASKPRVAGRPDPLEAEATIPVAEGAVRAPAQAGAVASELLGREDELRPVTSLFADIVGSTGIGEQLRPDEVKSLVGECVTRMSRIVEQYGGVIDAYMGDGIAAFFGVPAAREDDAERAARAALRIIEQIGRYAQDVRKEWSLPDFNIRVGLNTGQVAVGLVGAGDPRSVALGDTTNVAARLQAAAEPGTIVVGGRTAEELRPRFLLEPLGEISVKGRTAAVEAWRLVRAETAPQTAETRPFVDRKEETRRLTALMQELVAGRGHVLLIVGESGIGKTRLLERLRESASGKATWLAGSCASYANEVSYSPFAEILRQWLADDPSEDAARAHSRLAAKLEQLLGAQATESIALLASLLAVGDESGPGLQDLSPDQHAKEIRNAYCTWARALSSTGPLILAVEDFQWADRLTRELADSLLEVVDSSPLLLATTFRVETETEGWRFRSRAITDYAHRTMELRLGPLGEDDAGQLLEQLSAGGLEESIKREIVGRADGNPLYLEQLLRLFQESGELRKSRTWAMTVVQHELPSGLESLLIARIDALPSGARRVVQTAAIVGRSFSPRLVGGAVGLDALPQTIELLLREEIIRERRSVPELEYEFTHGLLREAALSTLPRARRRDMYRGVAAAIERIYGDSLNAHLEELAYYNARAGDLSRSLWYLIQAARNAAAIGASTRAVELWKRASDLAEKTDDVDAQRQITRELWQLGERGP